MGADIPTLVSFDTQVEIVLVRTFFARFGALTTIKCAQIPARSDVRGGTSICLLNKGDPICP